MRDSSKKLARKIGALIRIGRRDPKRLLVRYAEQERRLTYWEFIGLSRGLGPNLAQDIRDLVETPIHRGDFTDGNEE